MSNLLIGSLVFLPICFVQAKEKLIYSASIEKGEKLGREWRLKPGKDCVPIIEKSPKGERVFIARIPTGKQLLQLNNLPEHTHIRVKFDLILKGSWDGIHKSWGPDIWRFDIDGGEPLVNASFCNFSAALRQSFPDFHGDKHAPNKNYANALEAETLGYVWHNGHRELAADSIYSFEFLLPHTAQLASLNFESIFNDVGGPESSKDQWYGLDNVSVSILSDPPQLTFEEVERQVGLLEARLASSRYAARLALIKSDKSFVRWLMKNRQKFPNLDIEALVKKLNHENFNERTEATNLLIKHGAPHRERLRELLESTSSPEVDSRLRHIFLEWKKQRKQSDGLKVEIVRLLKIINTKESQELLSKMVK